MVTEALRNSFDSVFALGGLGRGYKGWSGAREVGLRLSIHPGGGQGKSNGVTLKATKGKAKRNAQTKLSDPIFLPMTEGG